MSEMQDKELDDLFRKSLKNPEIPFDLDAWKAMEAKLNADEDRRRAIYYRIAGTSVISMAVIVLLIAFFTTNDRIDKAQQSVMATNDKVNVASLDNSTAITKNNLQIRQEETNKRKAINTQVQKSIDQMTIMNEPVLKIRNKTYETKRSEAVSGHRSRNSSSEQRFKSSIDTHTKVLDGMKVGVTNADTTTLSSNAANDVYSANEQRMETTDGAGSGADSMARLAVEAQQSNQMQKELSVLSMSSTDEDTSETIEVDSAVVKDSIIQGESQPEKRPDAVLFRKFFSINLVFNPEFSSTVHMNLMKPGFNVGLNLEYYLSRRVSIIGGVMYSKKMYYCNGYDYTAPPSYSSWGNTFVPTTVYANCHVLDIPLAVRYKYLTTKTWNLYITSGVSSYIMLKENYNFEYSVKTPGSLQSEQVVNKNRYLFNIYNISLGIEKYIKPNWSVQVEPYAKIPMIGIGEGKIKLVSTGVYFSVKYYFK